MTRKLFALTLIGVAGISGCSSMQGNLGAGNGTAATEGAESRGAVAGSRGEALSDPLSKKVFYFPYDSYEVSAADRAVLIAHARYLAANPKVKVFVQGNADERGTHEYNLALGERRAQAIQSFLLLQGVHKSNTEAVSFGQENPVAFCHDESCWQLNRRVELIYPGS